MSFLKTMVLWSLVALFGTFATSFQAISQDKIDGTVAYFIAYHHPILDDAANYNNAAYEALKLEEKVPSLVDTSLRKNFRQVEAFSLQNNVSFFASFRFEPESHYKGGKSKYTFTGNASLYDSYGQEILTVTANKSKKNQAAVAKILVRAMEKAIKKERSNIEANNVGRCLYCGYQGLDNQQKKNVTRISLLAHFRLSGQVRRETGLETFASERSAAFLAAFDPMASTGGPESTIAQLLGLYAVSGDLERFEHLLDLEAINIDGGLSFADRKSHLLNEMIKVGMEGPVLDKVAALYADNGFNQQETKSKYTPLIRAVIDDDVNTIKKLLEYGADPNQRATLNNRSISALESAAVDGSLEIVELLLANGANKNEWFEDAGYAYNQAINLARYTQAALLRPDVIGDPTSPENQNKLVQAALFSDAGSIQYYLNSAVPVDSISFSGTPVFHAVLKGKQIFASNADAERQARERLGDARYDEIKQQIAVFQTSLNYWYSLEEIPEAEREGVEHLAKQTEDLRQEISQNQETEEEFKRRLGDQKYKQYINYTQSLENMQSTLEIYKKSGSGEVPDIVYQEIAKYEEQLASLDVDLQRHYVNSDDAYRVLNQLFDSGVNLDLRDAAGDTALMLALKNHQYDVAYTLVNNGANLDIANNAGDTPLSLALAARNEPMAVSLIEAGANFNNSRSSTPPVMMAYNMDMADAAAAMVARGADYSVTDEDGLTLLHYASARGDMGLVSRLIEAGADVNALDYDDNSALYYAYPHPSQEFGNESRRVIRALREAGADANHVNLVGYTAAENYRVGRETWQEEQRIRQMEDLTLRQEMAAKQQQLAAQALEQERQRRVAAIAAERRRRAEAAKKKSGFNWGKFAAIVGGSIAGGGLELDSSAQADILAGAMRDSMPGVQINDLSNTRAAFQQAGNQRQVTLRQAPDPALTHPDVRQPPRAGGQTTPSQTNTPPAPQPTEAEKDRNRLPIHTPPERSNGPIYQIAWVGWADNFETEFGYSNPDSAVDLLRTMIINEMSRRCRAQYKGGILLPDTIQWIPLPKEHPDAIKSRRWTASNAAGQVQCRYPDPRPRR